MIRSLLLSSLILLGSGSAILAQSAQFPYEAEVVAQEAYVRSGPGKKYYPTGILKLRTRVTVRRHDPGGWFMIDPPQGSFSWIRAEHVTKNGNVGTVNVPNVIARVGSSVQPESQEVEQIRLSKGDQVQILGEKTFNQNGQPVNFYQIAPPRFEYRWIMGQFLVPIDATLRRERDKNPFNSPPTPDLTDDSIPKNESLTNVSNSDSSNTNNPATLDKELLDVDDNSAEPSADETSDVTHPDQVAHLSDEQKMELLDEQFREMIHKQPTFWNLDKLERGYEQIQAETNRSAIARQIVLRLDAVERYRNVQKEYEEFVKITKSTNDREAQLLAMQQSLSGGSQPNPTVQNPSPAPIAATSNPNLAGTTQQSAGEQLPPEPPAETPANQPRRFDGAGIVQRSAATFAGAPRYVLLAPNGRILAYLQPMQGINLEQHLGQARGIYGDRVYNNSLRADLIQVRQLVPVILQTSAPVPPR